MEKSLDISELASGTVGVLGKLSSLNETLCEIRDIFSDGNPQPAVFCRVL